MSFYNDWLGVFTNVGEYDDEEEDDIDWDYYM
jgi:hypothetical protein